MDGKCLNLSKSKYQIKGIGMMLIMSYCALFFSGAVGWRIYLCRYLPKNYLLIYIYAITLLFYIGLYSSKERQLLKMEFFSVHSKKCLHRTKKCLYYLFCLILAVMMLTVFPSKIDSQAVYNLSLLFFIGIVGYMVMNYQFIVGFGDKGYISGDGKLFYDEIDKVEEIKRVQTADGILVYTRINLLNNKVCFDKFLTDEYIFLVNKVANG